MDRQTLLVMGVMLGSIVGSAAVNNLTSDPFIRQATFPILLVVSVGVLVLQDQVYKVTAAEYLYLRMAIRPSEKSIGLWIKNNWVRDLGKDGVTWMLELAHASKEIANYGRLKSLVISLPPGVTPNNVITWVPDEVYFKDVQIKHAKTAQITVDQQSDVASNIERGFVEPIFYLREASNFTKGSPIVNSDVKLLAQRLESAERGKQELFGKLQTEHDLRLGAEEIVKELRTELQTLRGLQYSVKKLALISIVTLLHLVENFDEVVKALGGRAKQGLVIKGLVAAVAIIAILVVFQSQPQLFDRLVAWWEASSMNKIYLLVAMAALGGGAYFVYRRMRRVE